MTKVLKVSDDVYEALQILRRYPLSSLDAVLKGLIDQVCPGVFFDDTDETDRELFRQTIGLKDWTMDEFRQYVQVIKYRRKNHEKTKFA
jgi:hypothetical protein